MFISLKDFRNKYNLQESREHYKIISKNYIETFENIYYKESDLELYLLPKDTIRIPSRIDLTTKNKLNIDLEMLFNIFKDVNDVDDYWKPHFMKKIGLMLVEDVFWMMEYPHTFTTRNRLTIGVF